MTLGQSSPKQRDSPGALLLSCLIPALLFLGLMGLFYSTYDPYLVAGPEIEIGGDFTTNPLKPGSGWKTLSPRLYWTEGEGFGGSAGLRLETRDEKGGRVDFVIENPRQYEALRLSGRMRVERVVMGRHPWRSARILLFFTDHLGKAHWDLPHTLCSLTGTQGWQRYEASFVVPSYAKHGQIVVQNPARSGTAWADDLHLTPVRAKSTVGTWKTLFATAWGVMLLYCIFRLRLWQRPWGTVLVLTTLIIVAGVALPATTVGAALEGPVELVASVQELAAPPKLTTTPPQVAEKKSVTAEAKTEERGAAQKTVKRARKPEKKKLTTDQLVTRNAISHQLKKSGHGLLFAVLGLFGLLSLARAEALSFGSIVLLLSGLLLFAAATELLQITVVNREPRLFDAFIDSTGATCGLSIAWLVHHLRRRGRSARE